MGRATSSLRRCRLCRARIIKKQNSDTNNTIMNIYKVVVECWININVALERWHQWWRIEAWAADYLFWYIIHIFINQLDINVCLRKYAKSVDVITYGHWARNHYYIWNHSELDGQWRSTANIMQNWLISQWDSLCV